MKPSTPAGSHEAIVREYSDALLDRIKTDLARRNLRNQSDHETRWTADRLKAVRAEIRRRKIAALS